MTEIDIVTNCAPYPTGCGRLVRGSEIKNWDISCLEAWGVLKLCEQCQEMSVLHYFYDEGLS